MIKIKNKNETSGVCLSALSKGETFRYKRKLYCVCEATASNVKHYFCFHDSYILLPGQIKQTDLVTLVDITIVSKERS